MPRRTPTALLLFGVAVVLWLLMKAACAQPAPASLRIKLSGARLGQTLAGSPLRPRQRRRC